MSCHIRSSRVSFARPQAELCLYRFVHCCVVLIDAASRDDSNGGQFVNIGYFDLCHWNSGSGCLVQAAVGFLTPFLTDKSRPMKLIIRLIDRAPQGLSKTPRIALFGRLGGKNQKIRNMGHHLDLSELMLHFWYHCDFSTRWLPPLIDVKEWRPRFEDSGTKIIIAWHYYRRHNEQIILCKNTIVELRHVVSLWKGEYYSITTVGSFANHSACSTHTCIIHRTKIHQISFIALCIFDGALIVIAASQLIIYSGLLWKKFTSISYLQYTSGTIQIYLQHVYKIK